MTLQQLFKLLKGATRYIKNANFTIHRTDDVLYFTVYNHLASVAISLPDAGIDIPYVTLNDVQRQVTRKKEKVLEDCSGTLDAAVEYAKIHKIKAIRDLYGSAWTTSNISHAEEPWAANITLTDFIGAAPASDMGWLLDAHAKWRVPDRANLDQIITTPCEWTSFTNGHFLIQRSLGFPKSAIPGSTALSMQACLDTKGAEDGIFTAAHGKDGKRDVVYSTLSIGDVSVQCAAPIPSSTINVASIHSAFVVDESVTSFSSTTDIQNVILDLEDGHYDDELFDGMDAADALVPVDRVVSFRFNRESEEWYLTASFRVEGAHVRKGSKYTKENVAKVNDLARKCANNPVILLRDLKWHRQTQYPSCDIKSSYKAYYFAIALGGGSIDTISLHHEGRDASVNKASMEGDGHRAVLMCYRD